MTYQRFYLKFSVFLDDFFIYLNRRVFVMRDVWCVGFVFLLVSGKGCGL